MNSCCGSELFYSTAVSEVISSNIELINKVFAAPNGPGILFIILILSGISLVVLTRRKSA